MEVIEERKETVKPNYKNWIPKGMMFGVIAGAILIGSLFVTVLFTDFLTGYVRLTVEIVLEILFCILFAYSVYCVFWYCAFSYHGKKQIARRIIEKIAQYVVLPENGKGLDVGCGSGALTIACAKNNPNAQMIGLDRWGKEYASFNQSLCESNAKIEGVLNRTTFIKGDASALPFADNSFDFITSNYCYHNIPTKNRQAILLESLRVLRKGGSFVIHDLFTEQKYGNMDIFLKQLKEMGFEEVKLFNTMDGLFLTRKEAGFSLSGSKLLIGKK